MTVKVEKKRIVTAVALVVFTAAVIFLGGWVTIAAAYLAMILVTMDAVRAIKKAGIRPMELIDYLICAAILPAYLLAHLTGVCLVLAIGVIITLCAAVFTKVRSFYDVVFTLFFVYVSDFAGGHALIYCGYRRPNYDAHFCYNDLYFS